MLLNQLDSPYWISPLFYSILIIAAIGAALYAIKRWQKLPESKKGGFQKKAFLYAVAGVVLALVVTGRAHWLMGVLAALLALAGRVAQFAQYIPLFKKLFGHEPPGAAGSQGGAPTTSQMSKQDAADILGVDVSASPEEIRMAHKKLMQKIHPDRGGTETLAKQINHAKKVLLG